MRPLLLPVLAAALLAAAPALAQEDPHAGHDMSAMEAGDGLPPDTPTSADNPGRPPEAPPPAAALTGPAHAADLFHDPAVMAEGRRQLLVENGGMGLTAVIIDRLEARFGDGPDAVLWDAQGWTGGDVDRFWWKTEGEATSGEGLEEAEVQALYSHAVSPFWDLQAGVRQDYRPDGPDRTHLALGVQGLAPYWWEVDAAAFLSTKGELTARVEAEYDLRITQRLILQPRLEVDLSAADSEELALGKGVTGAQAGLRLRYEIRREFAPYVGVDWSGALGGTRGRVRAAGGEVDDTRVVLGLRTWF